MNVGYESFLEEFGGEDACLAFFIHYRWPSGYRCPSCDHHERYLISTRRMPLFECVRCRYQSSVTSGTALEGTRTPLSKWLYTMTLLSNPEARVNAVYLSKALRVTYKTAYSMLDKIRCSLSLDTPDKLTGEIQAGLSILGNPSLSRSYLSENQHPVAVGVSVDSDGCPTRLAMMAVPPDHMHERLLSRRGIHLFMDRCVAPDSALINRKDAPFYSSFMLTKRHCKSLSKVVNSCFAQIQSTYHGIHSRSLSKYLAEMTFRWNASKGDNPVERITCACFASSRSQLPTSKRRLKLQYRNSYSLTG